MKIFYFFPFVLLVTFAPSALASCYISHCLSCSSYSSYKILYSLMFYRDTCYDCYTGYYLSTYGSYCYSCPTGCYSCNNSSYCYSCNSGYELSYSSYSYSQTCVIYFFITLLLIYYLETSSSSSSTTAHCSSYTSGKFILELIII